MYPRLRDKEPSVRIQAINALSRIQEFEDEQLETSILEIFLDTLQHDPSADVRKAVLININVLQETIPFIIERARDMDVNVRRYWYKKKLEEIDWRCLTIEQRQFILRSGLMDRDEMVKKYCYDIVFQNWITKVEDNLIYLLSCFDVVSDPKVGEVLLKGYFRSTPNVFSDFSGKRP